MLLLFSAILFVTIVVVSYLISPAGQNREREREINVYVYICIER